MSVWSSNVKHSVCVRETVDVLVFLEASQSLEVAYIFNKHRLG